MGGAGMTTGTRTPTWRERENNKRRERRRRAIAAKIYAGLRMYGNYKMPKHCDNNEVLKAVCAEAGWTVEADGTTYRKGCKPPPPPAGRVNFVGGSASPSPCSSYQPSPCTSYNPSPVSSSFPSPASSSYIINTSSTNGPEGSSFLPWLKNLCVASSSASSAKSLNQHHLFMHGGSISAPVTPPLSSPTARTPRIKTSWEDLTSQPPWAGANCVSLPSSTPSSPGRNIVSNNGWLMGIPVSSGNPVSPTFSLVSPNPFSLFKESSGSGGTGSSRMLTPGQSGTSSPVVPGGKLNPMLSGITEDFAFRSGSNDKVQAGGPVKPWEGETIHEECGSDDLELTLGNSTTRAGL